MCHKFIEKKLVTKSLHHTHTYKYIYVYTTFIPSN